MELNLARRHLSNEQKREVIEKLVAARPELSSNAIAQMARVSHNTVEAARANRQIDNKPEAETKTDTPTAEPAPQPERREASGRRARGRKPRSGTATAARSQSAAAPKPKTANTKKTRTPLSDPTDSFEAVCEVLNWLERQPARWQRQIGATLLEFMPRTRAFGAISDFLEMLSDDERQQFDRRFAPKISRGMIPS